MVLAIVTIAWLALCVGGMTLLTILARLRDAALEASTQESE